LLTISPASAVRTSILQLGYYCDDAQFEFGPIKLDGKRAIIDTYRRIYEQTPETLTVHQLIADEDGIAANVTFESRALVDVPTFLFGPLRKGEMFTFFVRPSSGKNP